VYYNRSLLFRTLVFILTVLVHVVLLNSSSIYEKGTIMRISRTGFVVTIFTAVITGTLLNYTLHVSEPHFDQMTSILTKAIRTPALLIWVAICALSFFWIRYLIFKDGFEIVRRPIESECFSNDGYSLLASLALFLFVVIIPLALFLSAPIHLFQIIKALM